MRTAPFKFNQQKAMQALAYLLKQKQITKTDNYMRALKLLYIADRESLKETGESITSDRFVAMERGPTLSNLYDLVKQRSFGVIEWDKYFQRIGFEIRLIDDPGNSKLCRYEIKKLQEISERYRDKDEWEVAKETETFLEWGKNPPGQSSRPIPLVDLLEAVGKKEWLDIILKRAAENDAAQELFGANC